MKKIFINIIYMIIDIQKKILKRYYDFKYRKISKIRSVSSKTYITAGERMSLNSQEKLDAKEVVENAKSVFKEYLKEPQGIFDYIKEQGTPIFVIERANTVLWFVGEEEGFIPPKEGISAILLALCINIFSAQKIPVRLKTSAMFVLRGLDVSAYFLAYQLYHWMAFTKNLSGYDPKTVKNFKNIFNIDKSPMGIKNLSIEEILSLQEAIARDVEAIDMVVALAKEVSGQKKAMDKLKKDGNISI